MERDLLYAKNAIFKLISQFHRASRFEDGEIYIYNYCESALEAAFNVLGIEDDYIKLMDFCQLREDNDRAIWKINGRDQYEGVTADFYYNIFKEDLERWERWMEEDDDE